MKTLPESDTLFGLSSAMCVDNNNLYIGGSFYTIGQAQANNIAVWNGKKWQNLGDGLSKHNELKAMPITAFAVCSLCIYKGYLYAGGHFNFSGEKPLNHIARWKLPKRDN